jgi:hypothetical protein
LVGDNFLFVFEGAPKARQAINLGKALSSATSLTASFRCSIPTKPQTPPVKSNLFAQIMIMSGSKHIFRDS